MSLQQINLNQILIEKSLFSVSHFLFESKKDERFLTESFQHLGLLNPVILYRDLSGRFHLIDGIKRIRYAFQNQKEMILAMILPETTSLRDVVFFIFNEKRDKISESVINKVQFISFAQSLRISETWIMASLCLHLGFKPHRTFLADCHRIHQLPEEIKSFCHEKKFSIKQILNLTYYPEELLLQMSAWKSIMPLTASVFEELATQLKDYLKIEKKSIQDFISEFEVQEILQSSLSPREKLEHLRQLIYRKRFPILSGINTKIEKIVDGLKLPKEMAISWDKTLENKRAEVILQLQNIKQWGRIHDKINASEMGKALKKILDEL